MNCASFFCTVTATFGVVSPNHSAPSCTICHWKFAMPATLGGGTAMLNVAVPPGATGLAMSMRVVPHVELFVGFCEPSLCTPGCHVVEPLLYIVTGML